jgi:hypothetical protein
MHVLTEHDAIRKEIEWAQYLVKRWEKHVASPEAGQVIKFVVNGVSCTGTSLPVFGPSKPDAAVYRLANLDPDTATIEQVNECAWRKMQPPLCESCGKIGWPVIETGENNDEDSPEHYCSDCMKKSLSEMEG